METVLIFGLIFGLFAWGMFKLLRFTRDTVGDNSPLKVQRVYQTSARRYFLGFDGIMAFLSGLMGVILLIQLLSFTFSADSSQLPVMYFALFLGPASLMGLSAFTFALLLNHWPYVRDVVIVTSPVDHSVSITFRDRELTLRENDIESVETVLSTSRMNYYYSTYYLSNGDRFVLSSRLPGQEVIQEYFPQVPYSGSYTQYGFIP